MAMETPWADERLLVGDTAKSYDDFDPCIISDHPAVSIISTDQKNISADDINQAEHLESLTNLDYMKKIMEVNDRLDTVKNIVRPGCSYEVLNAALCYMSSLATILSKTQQKLQASL